MPITNYLPSSRLIQPGVCTSTTRPATPFEGQAIFETDTDRMLIWNGTTWVVPNAPAQNPTGMELVKTESFTTQDPYDLTNVFSSNYRFYKVLMEVTGSSVNALNAQFLSGTNTPYTLTNYYRYGFYVGGGSTFNGFSQANQTNMFITNSSSANASPIEMTIFSPNTTDRKYVMVQSFDPNSGLQIVLHHQCDTSTQFTGLRFDAAAGSISGRTRVYGYRD
jgi:hypothetical protein